MRRLQSRRYVWVGLALWFLAVAAGWGAMIWPPAIFAMSILLVVSLVLVLANIRPAKDIHERREPPRNPLPAPSVVRRDGTPYRYPLLRPEDEAEVERLYQRLKTVGRLDSMSSTDEM